MVFQLGNPFSRHMIERGQIVDSIDEEEDISLQSKMAGKMLNNSTTIEHLMTFISTLG